MKTYRKLLRFIYGVPQKQLNWTVKDFKIAKSILKRYDHPFTSKRSLWDYYNSPWYESTDILQAANNIICSPLPK